MWTDPQERILRLKAVLDRTGFSCSTLYRQMQRGKFPKQVRISEGCVGWYETDIEDWLDSLMPP